MKRKTQLQTIKGSPLALRIAAGNLLSFADFVTGGYGTTI